MRTHGRKVMVLSVLAVLLALTAFFFSGTRQQSRTELAATPTPPAAVPAQPARFNSTPTAEQRKIAEVATQRLPMTFELNMGQSTPEVKFQARGHGYGLFLGEGAAFLMLKNHNVKSAAPVNGPLLDTNARDKGITSFLKLTFCNANEHANIHGITELETKTHYYKGPESNWVTNVPNYAKVCYDDLYPGIDLVYYGTQSGLEYDYVVKPGADPKAISMEIGLAKKLTLTEKGELLITMDNGQIQKGKPIVYQEINGQRQTVEGSYVLETPTRIAFKLGAYDRTQTLVIDPSIVWSTYVGDAPGGVAFNNFGQDKGRGIAVDNAGNVYVTGSTDSYDFPHTASLTQSTLNRFTDPSLSGTLTDAFIQEFAPNGGALIFSAFFGGNSSDEGRAVAVDASGFIYFTGFAGDGTFPVKNARFVYSGGKDAFVAKVTPGGAGVVYSTFIGGGGDDIGLGIAFDNNGNAYVAGSTQSANFPTKLPLVSTFSGVANTNVAGFLAKFSTDGSNVVFSTYIDGPGPKPVTVCNAVAVDNSGNIYVGGTTDGLAPILTQNAFQSASNATGANSTNGFVLKVDTNAGITIFGTYLGGAGPDGINGIGVDNSSRVFVTGFTKSPGFPTQSPNQGALGGVGAQNAFFTIFANTGKTLDYSTFLGGSGIDSANGMAVDPDGYAYIIGTTFSINFPVALAAQPPIQAGNAGVSDVFIAKYNPTGGEIYATYLGSSGPDEGNAIAAGVKGSAFEGNAYLTGAVGGRDGTFGTIGAFQQLAGATNPSFFTQVTVVGNVIPPGSDITGVSNASIANLGVGYTLLADAGGFLAGETITALSPNTITMSGLTSASIPASASFTFVSNVPTAAPDVFVTHIGDLSPRITSALTIIAAINQPIPAYTITATNSPTSFGAAGLASVPLSISGANNNIINGTPVNPGVFQVLLTASNAAGTGTAFLNIVVNGSAPAVLSQTATVVQGQGFSYNITATQNPTSFSASNLPPGLTIDTLTGNISGTPTISGTYVVPISATNNVGTGNATLTINVTPQPPVIVSSLTANGTANAPFTYTINALNNPTSFTAAPLPPGLSLNTSTGQISGIPTAVGVTNVVLTATNAGGSSVVTPTLVITIDNKPVINSALSVSATVNTAFTYTITALNNPTSFTAVGLPPGLTLPAASATISGTPTVAGIYSVTLGATNASGTGQAILTLTVSPGPPVITSSPNATFSVNSPFIYTITATNSPTAFAANNLPAGLTLDPVTGIISGTVTTVGVYTATVTASNSAGTSAPLTVTITIGASPPIITSTLTATGFVANGFSYTITSSGSAPQTYTAGPLPPGLAFAGNMISGVPSQEGTYAVVLTATNSLGTDTKTLIISISSVVTSIKELDIDGDGFPDELELGVGTNPTDPKSTPFGGAPAGTKHVANITSMQVKLDFSSATSTRDGVSIKGTLPVPFNFKGPPKNVVVFVGGIVRQFAALTPVSPAGPKDSFTLKVTNKQDPAAQPFATATKPVSTNALTATFQVKLSGANFKTLLFDEGLVGTVQIKDPVARTVDVIILLEDIQGFYQSAKVLQYTVHGKTGLAKNGR